jgi:PAS domain S-box-containing protein
MVKKEKSAYPNHPASPSSPDGEEDIRPARPPLVRTGDSESEFDEKLAGLVASFEDRIRKFKEHIAALEARINELQAAKDRARSAFDEFLNIQELSEMIRNTHDPGKVVETLGNLIRKFIEYDAMGVYLFGPGGQRLEPLGAQPARLNQVAQSQYEEGIIDWIISERRAVVVPWTESFGVPPGGESKNLVVAPLIAGDETLGIALISTPRRADNFSAQELRMLQFAVSHAAIAIQNALRTREISSTKDFLSNILENAGDIIFSLDQNGNFNYVNPQVETLGYQKEDLLEKHYRTVFKQQETIKRIDSTLRHGSRQVFEFEYDRGTVRTQKFTVNLVPLKQMKGRSAGALGIMRNVTELSRLQKKLLESERLAAYTQTVITLNHEINNPLTTVMGNVYLLEKEAESRSDDKLLKRLDIIQENCKRIQQVIKKLERINELKTVSYLGSTKMVDLGDDAEDK